MYRGGILGGSEREHTRQTKQDKPINQQQRPKHRNIKDLGPRAQEPDRDRPRRRVPELKLGQSADEGSELVVLFCGEAGFAVFETFVLGEERVEFGLEEGEEEV